MAQTRFPTNVQQPAAKATAPKVDHIREEVVCLLDDYKMVDDFLGGPSVVRKAGEAYLPMPEPVLSTDTETKKSKKQARYSSYKTRAVFYDVTAKTLGALVGQIFAKDTVISLPETMLHLVDDVDNAGTTLEQQAKKVVNLVVGRGRSGLLVDYTNVVALKEAKGEPVEDEAGQPDTEVTKADLEKGGMRSKIVHFDHKQIINWRTGVNNGKTVLTLVVLHSRITEEDDGFEEVKGDRWLELRLVDGFYRMTTWKKGTGGNAFEVESSVQPKDSTGAPFEYIPFYPIGWETNDIEPDTIPLLGIAELAAGLWRNSADYQENVFYTGQSTPWFGNLTTDWVKTAMKDGVRLGAREAVLLPEGGTAGLLTAPANTQVKESMDMLLQQLVALGAKLVEPDGQVKTATEASGDLATANSVLSSSASNVSAAYVEALRTCARFEGVEIPEDENDEDALDFQLNTDFAMSRMTPQERQVLLAEVQGGLLTWKEGRNALKRAGIAYEDDDKAKAEIEAKQEEDIAKGLARDPAAPEGKEDEEEEEPTPPTE